MRTLKVFSNQDLIQGCIAGKPKFQKALYEQFAPKMYGVCLRYAKEPNLAQDLLQEGFIKVFRYIENFRGDGAFEGWMRRIFVNTAIEYFRKQVHLYPIQDVSDQFITAKTTSVLDDLAQADLVSMIQELSPGYRTVFNMYVIDGFTHKEIAATLNISEGTSKSQLARARYMMQEKLESLKNFEQKANS